MPHFTFGKGTTLAALTASLLLGCLPSAAIAQDSVSAAAGTYSNPVLNESFADPSSLRVGNTLYAYATGVIGTGYFPVSTSTDFVNWTAPMASMPDMPSWATAAFWAPTVMEDPNSSGKAKRYIMYFTATTNNNKQGQIPSPAGSPTKNPNLLIGHCLGVAVADSPTGPFKELKDANNNPRQPLVCGTGYRNIDPMPFHDPKTGNWYLFWGSEQGEPILKKQLSSADLTKWQDPSTGSDTVLAAGPAGTHQRLVEGAYVIFRDHTINKSSDGRDYYYLFTSGNNCCSPDQTVYAVSVARSTSLDGPWTYYKNPKGFDNTILHYNSTWGNPGGNGIFEDGKGGDWMIYHAVRSATVKPGAHGVRVLLIDPVTYVGGWPRVNPNAANPDSPSVSGQGVPAPYAMQ